MYRLENTMKNFGKEKLRTYFRAAQCMHNLGMEVFEFIIPVCVTGGEVIILFTLFVSIRLNILVEPIIVLTTISIGGICFFVFKKTFDFASRITEACREFSQPPFLQRGNHFEKQDRLFLLSCKPLEIKIGAPIVITKNTFPTISQDVILGNLFNLLLIF